MQRVITYIDGFNLYYGLRSKRWKRFYWLDLQKLVELLLKPDQILLYTKYFTSIVNYPTNKNRRQNTYLEALKSLPNFGIYHGHFLSDTVTCKRCGHTYITHHEKMTDVNIAVQLLSDAFQDRLDMALLFSADGDLVGPVRMLRQLFPQKRVIVVFPPGRRSNALKDNAHACLHITKNMLSRSLFPNKVVSSAGVTLQRPTQWR